jgi:hypothetical protein
MMRNFLAAFLTLGSMAAAVAQSLPEFNGATGVLTIPEVKVNQTSVYNALLKYDGKGGFVLQSYDRSPPATTPAPTPEPTPAPTPAPANVPPVGNAALTQEWIASGVYKTWACEPTPHAQTLNSPHGRVRICSNPLLAASTGSTHPIGATSFKELYSGSTLSGYALGVKIKAGTTADTWFWYEVISGSTVANAAGAGICEGCHNGARATDRVFVRVP